MRTKKNISKAIQFLKSLKMGTKVNTGNKANFELTHTRFSINSGQATAPGKAPNSLFQQMNAEDNETLFI